MRTSDTHWPPHMRWMAHYDSPADTGAWLVAATEHRTALEHAQQLLDDRDLARLDEQLDDPTCEWPIARKPCPHQATAVAICLHCGHLGAACSGHRAAVQHARAIQCTSCGRSGTPHDILRWVPIFESRSRV